MSGTNGVSGNGNNFQIPNLLIKPNSKTGKTEQPSSSTPINMKFGNIERKELGLINPYSSADATITEAREIASSTNDILAKLGYKYKVSPQQVASVANGLNEQTIPALNNAADEAVAVRVATPKGPFAELFT